MLPKSVLDDLQKNYQEFVEDLVLEDYCVGIKYTYAIVSGSKGKSIGLAYTPLEDTKLMVSQSPRIENLYEMLSSFNLMDRAMGLAILNAISQYLLWNCELHKKFEIHEGNLIDFISDEFSEPNTTIVVVGNMVPLVERLRKRHDRVLVLERNPYLRGRELPDSLFGEVVPLADILIITGATLVNGTIDFILRIAKTDRIALVGPTAGILPSGVEKISVIASLRPMDIEKIKDTVKLGGGRWDFSKFCKDYIVTLLP